MVTLTLGQSAKEVGVSKATLSKAVKSGRLSYVAKSPAGYEIDPAELFRVFPPKPSEPVEAERFATPPVTVSSEADQREIHLLREQLDEIRSDRDAWREQAQRLALAPPETVAAPVAPPVEKRGIWPWRRSEDRI